MNLVQNKPAVVVVGLVVAAGVAWLVFGFFGVQTLFIDNEVIEAGPVFESGAGTEEVDDLDDSQDAATDEETVTSVANDEEVMEDEVMEDEVMEDEVMEDEVVTVAQGSFTGDTGHTVIGTALVLTDGTEQRFLRLESFESTNGPDLNVYLRADDGEFVDLGDLKGNIGDQNYEIPTDVDLERFNTVQIWCVRFGILFGDATLA